MMDDTIYDHYVAIEWASSNMAIARMTRKSNKITVIDVPSDIEGLKLYIDRLKGTKVLALEETTTSQWLYTELKEQVDKIVVCDPHRNRLLSEGPKNDKIDASKLVQLLKAGLLKEVFHTNDDFLLLRRLVSGYEDLVKAGVRLKNQRYSLLKACGNQEVVGESAFVLGCLNRQIDLYEQEKSAYEKEFMRLAKKYPAIRHQKSLPGIGDINAVKIVARVVSPFRFADKGHYCSYAGLIKHEKISGKKSYGKRTPRYCRQLKDVYKTGVSAALGGNNPINDYYEYLVAGGEPEYDARHKACRRLATLSLGVFKSGEKYQPYKRSRQTDNVTLK
jgi:transposase